MQIPQIDTAGFFDSKYLFRELEVSPPRQTIVYELEVFYDKEGVTILDGKEIPIAEGYIIFAVPGMIRQSHLPFRTRYIKFTTEDPGLTESIRKIPYMFYTDRHRKYIALIDDSRRMLEEAHGEPMVNYWIGTNILELVRMASEDGDLFLREQSLRLKRNTLREVIEYMENNFRTPLSLSGISAHFGYSPNYFHRIFRTTMGKTPWQYLTELRIAAAKEMLITKELPVAEIALQCGFSSPANFNYLFKKTTGVTPTFFTRNYATQYFSRPL